MVGDHIRTRTIQVFHREHRAEDSVRPIHVRFIIDSQIYQTDTGPPNLSKTIPDLNTSSHASLRWGHNIRNTCVCERLTFSLAAEPGTLRIPSVCRSLSKIHNNYTHTPFVIVYLCVSCEMLNLCEMFIFCDVFLDTNSLHRKHSIILITVNQTDRHILHLLEDNGNFDTRKPLPVVLQQWDQRNTKHAVVWWTNKGSWCWLIFPKSADWCIMWFFFVFFLHLGICSDASWSSL